LHACLNHGVTIATVQINTIPNFQPLAIFFVERTSVRSFFVYFTK
jgi:hypothetical protein